MNKDLMVISRPIRSPLSSPCAIEFGTDSSDHCVSDMGVNGAATAYAFQVSSDSAKMMFDGYGGTLKFVRNKPITMDEDITGEIHVPPAYDHFLVTKLAESASLRYQFSESASLFAQKGKAQGNTLANNVVANRPIPHKTAKNLNRFRR